MLYLVAAWAVDRIQIGGSIWKCPLSLLSASSGYPALTLSESQRQGGQAEGALLDSTPTASLSSSISNKHEITSID